MALRLKTFGDPWLNVSLQIAKLIKELIKKLNSDKLTTQ
jgi:hypothetical protein